MKLFWFTGKQLFSGDNILLLLHTHLKKKNSLAAYLWISEEAEL